MQPALIGRALLRPLIGAVALVASAGLALSSPAVAHADDTPVTPSDIADRTIVAIGDSYLAGVGAGDYRTIDGCRRSVNSPAAKLAERTSAALVDLTCPGNTIPQALRTSSRIPATADLTLIQAGGNDIGFAVLAGACLLAGASTCQSAVDAAHRELPQVRRGTIDLVRQARLKAPASQVIVLGYPRLLAKPATCSALLDRTRVRDINRLQRTLDRVIKSATRTAGATFVDWPRSVDRASLCSSDPWYALPGDRIDDLLHPDSRATTALSRSLAKEWRR